MSTIEQDTQLRYRTERARLSTRVVPWIRSPDGIVWIVLGLLLIAVMVVNPQVSEPGQATRLLARMAPTALVAIGQYFVLVSGEFDLSIGAVIGAQVVLAGTLIGDDPRRIFPVSVLMIGLAVTIGLVNGLVTTLLRVPGFITTFGTALVLSGLTFNATGGSAGRNPVEQFRALGRDGIELPVIQYLPWALVVLVVVAALAAMLMRRPFGRLLVLSGDNSRVAYLAGARPWWLQTRAYILSALLATLAAVLLVGFAGVHPAVGSGYEFTSITAAVLGGVALGGGRGRVLSALAGGLVLESLLTFLNFLSVDSTWRPAVQGATILLAVAAASVRASGFRGRQRAAPPSADPNSGPAVPKSPPR